MKQRIKIGVVCTLFLLSAQAGATDEQPLPNGAKKIPDEGNATEGFQFTTGIGLMKMRGGDVTSAVADNGVVRVTGSENARLGFWAAAHSFTKSSLVEAWGPFFAVQLGGENNKLVNSFAIGLSWTSNRPVQTSGSSPLVFSIGVAASTKQNLSEPYVDGEKLPTGSSQPLLKKSTIYGPVLIVSYRFGAK